MTAKLKISDDLALPADLGDRKIAMLAMSKAGKTYGLGDILEELYLAQRPFIAIDPANNLWGLRSKPDGTPSDFDVVVIGGDHADIPLEKDAGERIAEALLSEPVCAVIDVAFESKNVTRRFVTDFCNRLMRTRSDTPRIVVLEEAPEFVPQKASYQGIQVCKAAVDRIIRVGGNFGYGAIIASQRSATIDKDVLSQCEALIVMRITDKRDRAAVRDWILAKDIDDQVSECFEKLGDLKDGEAWLWWPTEGRFERFTFRKRQTLHPRDMRKLGLSAADVTLGDARRFVEKVRRELTRAQAVVPDPVKDVRRAINRVRADVGMSPMPDSVAVPTKVAERVNHELAEAIRQRDDNMQQIDRLQRELKIEKDARRDADARLKAARELLRPQYVTLRALFETIAPAGNGAAGAVDLDVYQPWLLKAGAVGCKKMLAIMIERRELTRNQLATLAGVREKGSTFRTYLSWLKRNGLIETPDFNTVRLRPV